MTVHLYLLANDCINMNAAYGTALLLDGHDSRVQSLRPPLSRKSK